MGLDTVEIGSLDVPGAISAGATVLDTWFPSPNCDENVGAAAILAAVVGHLDGSRSYRLGVADLERAASW